MPVPRDLTFWFPITGYRACMTLHLQVQGYRDLHALPSQVLQVREGKGMQYSVTCTFIILDTLLAGELNHLYWD